MKQGEIINLADRRAEKSRGAQLNLLSLLGPDKITAEFAKLERATWCRPNRTNYRCLT